MAREGRACPETLAPGAVPSLGCPRNQVKTRIVHDEAEREAEANAVDTDHRKCGQWPENSSVCNNNKAVDMLKD